MLFRSLLQRSLCAGAPAGGRAPDGGDPGSPPPRSASSVACPLLRAGKSDYPDRSHAQGAPEVCGADAFAADGRSPADRALYRPTGGSDPGGQAPSGDGIPVLSGNSAAGQNLSRRTHGSGGAAGSAGSRLQLPEHGLDPEEPARPAAGPGCPLGRALRPGAPGNPPVQAGVEHDNSRGADYFDSPPEADPPAIQ